MGANTKIEWADHTANFWVGCTQVSPACDFCYAKSYAERFGMVAWNGPPKPVLAGEKVVRAARRIAVETGRRQFVFVNSLSDFFDNQANPDWRRDALYLMRRTPECIFLLLTKRIGNVADMLRDGWGFGLPNVWLGITVVNQTEADRDIPKLLALKADENIQRVFLSIEPMLGPIDLDRFIWRRLPLDEVPGHMLNDGCEYVDVHSQLIDWVICGGESGKQARPMHPDWARSLRDQCAAAGVPFMFKQWGEHAPLDAIACPKPSVRMDMTSGTLRVGKAAAGRLLDGVEHNGRPQP